MTKYCATLKHILVALSYFGTERHVGAICWYTCPLMLYRHGETWWGRIVVWRMGSKHTWYQNAPLFTPKMLSLQKTAVEKSGKVDNYYCVVKYYYRLLLQQQLLLH